jgi:hypothetical protein
MHRGTDKVVCKASHPKSSTFCFWQPLNAAQQKPKELDGKTINEVIQ